jgi:Serine dehydrogenase proteinase
MTDYTAGDPVPSEQEDPAVKDSGSESSGTEDGVLSELVPPQRKTPFYQAVNAERYQRQALIKEINKSTGHPLICYVSGAKTEIDRDDTIGFVDVLHNISQGSDLDLMLHTGGGDFNAADKLISLIRRTVGNGTLRIIVPDFAKSAGTLMCLGADRLLMSDTSELGPIDPQIVLADGDGNRIRYSVLSYIDAYKEHSDRLKADPTNISSQLMINKFDPMRLKQFEAFAVRVRKIAEDTLKRGMFRKGSGNYSLAANTLLDTKRWPDHGQMITWEDATDPSIGLIVDHIDSDSLEWEQYWQLYCLHRWVIKDHQKIFESDYASLVVDGS